MSVNQLRFPSNFHYSKSIFVQTNFLQLFNISCERCSPIFSTQWRKFSFSGGGAPHKFPTNPLPPLFALEKVVFRLKFPKIRQFSEIYATASTPENQLNQSFKIMLKLISYQIFKLFIKWWKLLSWSKLACWQSLR
jgi:hypothetical protein